MTIKELRNPEVLEEITKMRALGESYKSISQFLEKDYNIKVHENAVRKMYQKLGKQSTNMIKANNEVKAILQSEVLDTTKQLRVMNERMNRLYEELQYSESKNRTTDMINISKEIRNQLEFQAKLLQQISDAPKAQNINYIDQSIKVVGILDGLAEDGYIKILKDLPDYNKDKV